MTNLMSDRARRMRHEATPAEKKLWKALKLLAQNGFHFRRQAPIGPYIADFAEMHARVIIECDGDDHAEPATLLRDERRDAWFEAEGFTVMRFSNHVVRSQIDDVVHAIVRQLGMRPYDNLSAAEIAAIGYPQSTSGIPPHPGPPPQGGRGSESVLKPKRQRRQRALPDRRAKIATDTPLSLEPPSPTQNLATPSPLVGEGWGGGDSRSNELSAAASSLSRPEARTQDAQSASTDCAPAACAALTDCAPSATSGLDSPKNRRANEQDDR